MVRLVDPQRLHGNPFRSAISLFTEIVPGGIGIRRDRAIFWIDLDHAETRADIGGWRCREYPAFGRDTDTNESEIVAERLHGLQRWTDFAGFLRFTGIRHRYEYACSQNEADGRAGQPGSHRQKSTRRLSIVSVPALTPEEHGAPRLPGAFTPPLPISRPHRDIVLIENGKMNYRCH